VLCGRNDPVRRCLILHSRCDAGTLSRAYSLDVETEPTPRLARQEWRLRPTRIEDDGGIGVWRCCRRIESDGRLPPGGGEAKDAGGWCTGPKGLCGDAGDGSAIVCDQRRPWFLHRPEHWIPQGHPHGGDFFYSVRTYEDDIGDQLNKKRCVSTTTRIAANIKQTSICFSCSHAIYVHKKVSYPIPVPSDDACWYSGSCL